MLQDEIFEASLKYRYRYCHGEERRLDGKHHWALDAGMQSCVLSWIRLP